MTVTVQNLVTRLGLKRSGREWRGKCPLCAYGNGAFVLSVTRTGKPMGWCASCQDRDGVRRLIGGVYQLPSCEREIARKAALQALRAERALSLWRGATTVVGTVAETYLDRRGLPGLLHSAALRFRPDTPHPCGGKLPALIAAVVNPAGAVIAVHRTFLTRDGRKASVTPCKASLGPIWGGAIRLWPARTDTWLAVAEGIETAASAGHMLGLPAWAAVSAGNLASGLALPSHATRITIAADPDEAGKRAARTAWTRWIGEGRAVKVATPDGTADFNDLLRSRELADA